MPSTVPPPRQRQTCKNDHYYVPLEKLFSFTKTKPKLVRYYRWLDAPTSSTARSQILVGLRRRTGLTLHHYQAATGATIVHNNPSNSAHALTRPKPSSASSTNRSKSKPKPKSKRTSTRRTKKVRCR